MAKGLQHTVTAKSYLCPIKTSIMEKHDEKNELGDIKFKRPTEEDWRRIRRDQHTYIFHEYDDKLGDYVPVFGLSSTLDNKMEEIRKDPEFMEVELYKSPDQPPYDFYIHYHNSLLAARVDCFKEVFDERAFREGYEPGVKYWRLILKKSMYNKIMNVLNQYHLLHLRDLLLEVIAMVQEKYITDVSFWNKKEMRDVVKTARTAADQATLALEKLDGRAFLRGESGAKAPTELEAVQFFYKDRTSVKINHSWMARDIITAYKRSLEDDHYKDWRKELAAWPDRFDDAIQLPKFQHDLAWSYYNLLARTGAIKVTQEEPTPNLMVECIAALIGLSSIPIGGDSDVMTIKEKAKNVRTWLTRYELEPASTHFEVYANKERLLKYFPYDFINLPQPVNKIEALGVAGYIANRFDIPDHMPDIAHLAQALIDVRWMIDHQVLGGVYSMVPPFEEFQTWHALLTGLTGGKKLSSLKFRLEGDDKEYELCSDQPLGNIVYALREYVDEHRLDIDVEAVPTQISRTQGGDLAVTHEPRFQSPKERFLTRFVTAFYDYLRSEVPPREHHLMPSLFYYPIIATVLAGARFFNPMSGNERWMISQVERWHKHGLAGQKRT